MNTNILSIDFDWIMEPSIWIYDHAANDQQKLSEVLENAPGVSLKPDYTKYKMLNVYACNIADQIANPERIIFANNHDDIVHCINYNWNLKNETYNIYNIDHHHDCGYSIDNVLDINKQGLNCGNWVGFCTGLKEYTWIRNKTSELSVLEEFINKLDKFQETTDINLINYIHFDYIFICLSPGWVPSELFPLYDTLRFNIEKEP